jgi:hypothetical protein
VNNHEELDRFYLGLESLEQIWLGTEAQDSLRFKLPATKAAVNILPMSSLNMPADVFILRIASEHYILFIR